MPIRPENKGLYPKNWVDLRQSILAREDHCCKFCQVPNHWTIYRDTSGQWHSTPRKYRHNLYYYDANGYRHKNIRIVLTIAHLNHDPRDNRPENLAALCQYHHNRHDIRDRIAGRRRRAFQVAAAADLFPGTEVRP